MSNKTQLQSNNGNLSTALENIYGLPLSDDVKHGKYIWKRTTSDYTGTYICYVVSDVENKYPCDGELGGHWYESIDKNFKISYGTVTVGAEARSIQISHGLGVTPKSTYLISDTIGFQKHTYMIINGYNFAYNGLSGNHMYWMVYSHDDVNDALVTFKCDVSYPYGGTFVSGLYTWIAIA